VIFYQENEFAATEIKKASPEAGLSDIPEAYFAGAAGAAGAAASAAGAAVGAGVGVGVGAAAAAGASTFGASAGLASSFLPQADTANANRAATRMEFFIFLYFLK